MATPFSMDRLSFRVNVEGQIKYGKNSIYRVIQSDTLFDRSDPLLLTLSKEGENCPEFKEMRKLILEKPLQDGKYDLRKDVPLEAVEGVRGEMSLQRIQETNEDIVLCDGPEIFIPSMYRQ